MRRTITNLALAATLATGAAAAEGPVAAPRLGSVDPKTVLARCNCLGELLPVHGGDGIGTARPRLFAPRPDQDSVVITVTPALLDDQPGVQLHLQW